MSQPAAMFQIGWACWEHPDDVDEPGKLTQAPARAPDHIEVESPGRFNRYAFVQKVVWAPVADD